jgi:hypothetical protein
MPLGFRESVRLTPGLRLNLGKRSAGFSVGQRGARGEREPCRSGVASRFVDPS